MGFFKSRFESVFPCLLHKKKKSEEENTAMASIPISYITATQLTKLQPSGKIAIVDVSEEDLFVKEECKVNIMLCVDHEYTTLDKVEHTRDEERSYDGHIAGSWHFASDTFHENLPDLVGRIRGQEVVVFHCALSQVRGPTCARKLVEHITLSTKSMDKVPQICILERGFNGWADSGHPICRCPKASCKGC